jgi:phosphoglycolate phosphatase-like HAD superfamily hydrolase
VTRTAVLWDIDGTLLSTARAGIKAWEDAARAVLDVDVDLSTMATSGLTDPMIARAIVMEAGCEPDPDLEARLGRTYTDALPSRLLERRGGVLPGVEEALAALHQRSDTVVGLLTGNYRAGAEAKLTSYGLRPYFDMTGGFGEDGFDRADIGRAALRRLQDIGDVDLTRVFLVGDTPYDIACGAAIGASVVAVATGTHGVDELTACGPWWCLSGLPDAQELLHRLGLTNASPARPGRTS